MRTGTVALALALVLTAIPDALVASPAGAAPSDLATVIVDGVGDSSGDMSVRWTRLVDADTLASRHGLGALVAASEASGTVTLVGSNGRVVHLAASAFAGDNNLPSNEIDLSVLNRSPIGLRVGFVGDSVGTSIAGTAGAELPMVTDGMLASLTSDVLPGRFISKTPPVPNGLSAAGGLPVDLDVVVVELGYNPSSNMAADIDAMMNVLDGRGARRVIWVNMAENRVTATGESVYRAANSALAAARNRWPTLAVADWNTASRGRAHWSYDGVHLTSTGQAELAIWLRQVLGGIGPIGRRTPDTGPTTPTRRLAPNERVELDVVGARVAGVDGVARAITSDAAAVALNVTAVSPSAAGFFTVWPCDVARPDASNLNFVAGSVVANGVIAPVGPSGKVCVFSNVQSELLVDIAGWFPRGASGAPTFVGTRPRRVVDTRNAIGGPAARVAAGATLSVPMTGAAVERPDGTPSTIPADATAVAVNVTAVGPTRPGFLTVWPCGTPRPEASNVNFVAGSAVANGVVASLGAGGAVCVYSNQETDVIVDVLGWFSGGTSGARPYVGGVPRRLVDTRNAIGGPVGPVGPSVPKVVPVRGATLDVGGVPTSVPSDATAVAFNITVVEAREAGFATVWPCGAPRPEASNLNFAKGATVANNVVAPIGADGSVCVHSSAPGHLIVDLAGWFGGGVDPAFTGNVPVRLVDTRNNIGPAPF